MLGARQLFSPVQPLKSLRRRAKADISGLSWMLFPFFPRSPHLPVKPSSTVRRPLFSFVVWLDPLCCLELPLVCMGNLPLPLPLSSAPPPPKIAETDDCAHRACFLIADVTVIHSVVIRATGSTAIDMLFSKREPIGVLGCVL